MCIPKSFSFHQAHPSVGVPVPVPVPIKRLHGPGSVCGCRYVTISCKRRGICGTQSHQQYTEQQHPYERSNDGSPFSPGRSALTTGGRERRRPGLRHPTHKPAVTGAVAGLAATHADGRATAERPCVCRERRDERRKGLPRECRVSFLFCLGTNNRTIAV